MAYVNSGAITGAIGAGLAGLTSTTTISNGGTASQFGTITLGGQAPYDNTCDDPEKWDAQEQVKMFVWFMKMHHEEDIKGFKAMRDIERSVERAQWEEQQRQTLAAQQKWFAQQQAMANQAQQATNPYIYSSSTTTTPYANITQPKKEPWWKKLLT